MRYLGNKSRLLNFIEDVIIKHEIPGDTLIDLFSGTGAVGDFFKDKYKIISNDYMYFSTILSKAKIENNEIPKFDKFWKKFGVSPFQWLNKKCYEPNKSFYIYYNYSPVGNRQYFTEENAIKIDGIRQDLSQLYEENILIEKEYDFLLASLIESVTRYSNTSGTYQAFLKEWDKRALKTFILEPLLMKDTLSVNQGNKVSNENANLLMRKDIKADIVYIDPPYTITQYTNSYHVLETIAKYDNPEIFGKTGRRKKREFSRYSNKSKAIIEFEDLFRQISIKHVLVSYSNHSIVPLEELIKLAEKFAKNGVVKVEKFNYRSYSTNNKSYKIKNEKLQEVILYFEKDDTINKSPLNYSGSKDGVLPRIFKHLPQNIDVFVDAMGGAFNVGANVTAMKKVVYNEYNEYIYGIIEMLLNTDKLQLLTDIETVIKEFGLTKKNKEAYNRVREYYNNENKDPLLLFVLQIYSFQNMIRFNNKHLMNVPIGNNEYNKGTKKRILEFIVKTKNFELMNKDCFKIDNKLYPKDTMFYFDPPYFITNAEYNDGKRGMEGWNVEKEKQLFNYLNEINNYGQNFMLSNVLYHKGKTHTSLLKWVKEHNYNLIEVGKTGIKYPRIEIIVTNYDGVK